MFDIFDCGLYFISFTKTIAAGTGYDFGAGGLNDLLLGCGQHHSKFS